MYIFHKEGGKNDDIKYIATVIDKYPWNAEGWFIVLKDSRVLAFTSEYGTSPPREITALFHEIEQLPASSERQFEVRDVCLGFCYDPVAALGFTVLSQRTRLLDANGGS